MEDAEGMQRRQRTLQGRLFREDAGAAFDGCGRDSAFVFCALLGMDGGIGGAFDQHRLSDLEILDCRK